MTEEQFMEELVRQVQRLADATRDNLVELYARIAALEAQVEQLTKEKAK